METKTISNATLTFLSVQSFLQQKKTTQKLLGKFARQMYMRDDTSENTLSHGSSPLNLGFPKKKVIAVVLCNNI